MGPVLALQCGIFAGRSRALFLLWIICVVSVMFLLCFCARLFVGDLWSPAGRRLASCLSFVVSDCEVDTFSLYIEN